MQALDADPARSRPSSRRRSAATRAGSCARYRARGRGDDRRRAGLGARHDRGRRSTSCARRACSVGALGDQDVPAVADGRGARRARPRAARVVVLEKALAVGIGGIVSADVRDGARRASRLARATTVIAGLGGRPITKRVAATAVRGRAGGRARPLTTFLDLDRELVERELERTRATRRSGPHAENMLRDLGVVAAGPRRDDALPADQVLPGGQLRGRQPPARPRAALGAGRHRPLQHAHLGPPRVPGLRRGARRALRARRGDARDRAAS